MDSVWLTGTQNQIKPGNRDRPGLQSCTLCSQKSHRIELYEPLTLPKFLPRMPPMDSPGNDQPPGTCTQVIKVTQTPFKFPRCGFYLYKHHCSFHPVEHSSVLWLGLCLQSRSPHTLLNKIPSSIILLLRSFISWHLYEFIYATFQKRQNYSNREQIWLAFGMRGTFEYKDSAQWNSLEGYSCSVSWLWQWLYESKPMLKLLELHINLKVITTTTTMWGQ